ncbi:MAG TPA: aldehyde dehydrogenase family protein [Vicinamibacterales bacterium]|nr:aldehyde dehydrogenase family protein [Vicinamibacterales bacterium]
MREQVSSSAVADRTTPLLPGVLERLLDEQPALGLEIVRALDDGAVPDDLREIADRLASAANNELATELEVDSMVARARAAQRAYARWSEWRVDELLSALSDTLSDHAEELARRTVQETGRGNVADKTLKNRFASQTVYESLSHETAHGVLSVDADRKVTELASPVGVIFAVVPQTNPIATAIFKTLIALKTRNGLILSFPQKARRVATMFSNVVREVLCSHSVPPDLIQWTRPGNRMMTTKLMRHRGVGMVLVTGGAGLVRAAYSSGTPAIGVGPGNAPAWICDDADVDSAAAAVVLSKAFDNGMICGAEHNLVVDAGIDASFTQALIREGAYLLTPEEAKTFTAGAMDAATKSLRPDLIGQSASDIAARFGIARPQPIRLLIVRTTAADVEGPYGGEKLAPVLSLFTVTSPDEALTLCTSLLERAGTGHTAIIHTASTARVDRFAQAMPASRIIVNSPGALGCCGMTTGLPPSMTLGCGTLGGNSTSDNVTYRQLLNIKRVAYHLV